MKKTIAISLIASALLFATGSDVSNLTIDYENEIINGTNINNAEVHQGYTEIDGSTVENVELKKFLGGNTIDNVEIDDANIEQATFIITDANASNSVANSIVIESDNSITNGSIKGGSYVRQSYTQIKSGSEIQGLGLKTINHIQDLSSDASDINKSTVDQGILIVSGASTVVDFDQDALNTLEDVDSDDANLTQNSIIVKNGSTITSFSNGGGTGGTAITNTMTNVSATDGAKVTQNTNIFDNSEIDGLTSTQINAITNVDVDQNAITQGHIEVTGSTVQDLDVNFDNKIENLKIIGTGSTEQGILIVSDSNATGDANIASFEILSTNKLVDTDSLDGSYIIQSKTVILGSSDRSIVTNLLLNQTNTIQSSTANGIVDNNLSNSASVSQAETVIIDSTVDAFSQILTNEITQVENSDSYLEQGYTLIQESDVNGLEITQINTTINSTLTDSTVTQGETLVQ